MFTFILLERLIPAILCKLRISPSFRLIFCPAYANQCKPPVDKSGETILPQRDFPQFIQRDVVRWICRKLSSSLTPHLPSTSSLGLLLLDDLPNISILNLVILLGTRQARRVVLSVSGIVSSPMMLPCIFEPYYIDFN